MDQEPIDHWLAKTAENKHAAPSTPSGVNVISRKHRPVNKGNVIVTLAEKLRPIMMEKYKNVRDENDQIVAPARIRALSLNMAQRLVKEYQT